MNPLAHDLNLLQLAITLKTMKLLGIGFSFKKIFYILYVAISYSRSSYDFRNLLKLQQVCYNYSNPVFWFDRTVRSKHDLLKELYYFRKVGHRRM